MDVKPENPIDLLATAQERPTERVLFVASVCPAKPMASVKFFLGPQDEAGLLFPGILDDIGEHRPFGPIYHLAMGIKYPMLGALQVDVNYPVWAANLDLLRAGVEILYATAEGWAHTHLICAASVSQGRLLNTVLGALNDCPIPMTVWSGDLSLGV